MNRRLLFLGLGLVGLIGLGLLAGQVGNVGVRRIQTGNAILMNLSEPIVPGVKSAISWQLPETIQNQEVEFRVRTVQGEQVLARGQLSDQLISVVFPCNMPTTNASVSMVEADNGELLSWRKVEALPPGPDCL